MILPRPFGPSVYRRPHRGLLPLLASLARGDGASEQIFYGEFDGRRDKRVLISPKQERRATVRAAHGPEGARPRMGRVKIIGE